MAATATIALTSTAAALAAIGAAAAIELQKKDHPEVAAPPAAAPAPPPAPAPLPAPAPEARAPPVLINNPLLQIKNPAPPANKRLFDLLKLANPDQAAILSVINDSAVSPGDLDETNERGASLLMVASGNPKLSGIVQALLTKGVKKDTQDKNGYSALSHAIGAGAGPIVDILIKSGVDVNVIDKLGQTALMQAVSKKNLDIVKKLVETGNVKIDAVKPGTGQTALDFADLAKDKSITDYLISKTAKRGNDLNLVARGAELAARLKQQFGPPKPSVLAPAAAAPAPAAAALPKPAAPAPAAPPKPAAPAPAAAAPPNPAPAAPPAPAPAAASPVIVGPQPPPATPSPQAVPINAKTKLQSLQEVANSLAAGPSKEEALKNVAAEEARLQMYNAQEAELAEHHRRHAAERPARVAAGTTYALSPAEMAEIAAKHQRHAAERQKRRSFGADVKTPLVSDEVSTPRIRPGRRGSLSESKDDVNLGGRRRRVLTFRRKPKTRSKNGHRSTRKRTIRRNR